jgi:hypothetical protein
MNIESKIDELSEMWHRRESNLEERIVEWATGSHLSADKANELIGIIRNARWAPDAVNELKIVVASLTQGALPQ